MLEPAAERHLADLLAAAQDDAVWAWLPWPRPHTRGRASPAMLDGERAVALPFAQVEAASGRAVGVTTYRDIDERHRTLEVGGTWLGPAVVAHRDQHRGEAAVLGHAFEALGANRVAIKTDIRNERSQAAIARLGAVREGVLRHQYIRRDGTLRDTRACTRIVPEEWPAVRAAPARRGSPRTRMSATVTQLTIAPVKGMRLAPVDALELGAAGARGDRAFCVVDPDDAQLAHHAHARGCCRSSRAGTPDGMLTLRFPDGERGRASRPRPARRATTANYAGRPIRGRLVDGALPRPSSAHLGRPAQLLARDDGERLADDAPVTLMSARVARGARAGARRRRPRRAPLPHDDRDRRRRARGRSTAGRAARSRSATRCCAASSRCRAASSPRATPTSGRTDAPVLKALAATARQARRDVRALVRGRRAGTRPGRRPRFAVTSDTTRPAVRARALG